MSAPRVELDEAVQAFTDISQDLLRSYEQLARRAEHVEQELCRKVEELDRTRAHLEAVLEALPTGVVARDAAGRVVRANDAALALLGCGAEDLVAAGEHPLLGTGTPEGVERRLARADGTPLVLYARTAEVRTPDGARAGALEVLEDRTQSARLAERLHAADKMVALGTMAGGIAHEIRNPLNAVQGFARLLLRGAPQDTREARYAARIAEGVAEADAIITSLLTFADPEALVATRVEPDELVRDAVEAALRGLPGGAERARWDVATDVAAPAFAGDRIKLRQALRNLVANALEAQPAGGAVRVRVARVGPDVELAVEDDGPGVAPDVARRVADPFFTTRAEGTGLGLSLVDTIARLHGGSFELACAEPRGARATLRLPFTAAS